MKKDNKKTVEGNAIIIKEEERKTKATRRKTKQNKKTHKMTTMKTK